MEITAVDNNRKRQHCLLAPLKVILYHLQSYITLFSGVQFPADWHVTVSQKKESLGQAN